MILQKDPLEPLLNRAELLEKKYEWLQAAEFYSMAADLALKKDDFSKAVVLTGRVGFCFFRAAYQAQTNTEFRERLRLAIRAHEREIGFLEKGREEGRSVRIKQARAWATYFESCLETDVPKKKQLFDEWWTLEKQVLEAYENIGDVHAVGVVCTDMITLSLGRVELSTHSEEVILEREAMGLAEKAIQALSKCDDDYELARAYCFASVWHCSQNAAAPEFKDKRFQLIKKGHDYSKKALELSSKTGDAWLIGWTYSSAWTATVYYDFNHSLAADYGEEAQKFGIITKDKILITSGTSLAYSLLMLAEFMEDPDKQRANCEKARKLSQECKCLSQIINDVPGVCWGYVNEVSAIAWLAAIETDPKIKQEILKNAIRIIREGLEVIGEWKRLSLGLYGSLSAILRLLSGTKSNVEEKKALLVEAQLYQKEHIAGIEEFSPSNYVPQSLGYYNLGLVQIELAKIETDKTAKAEVLENVVVTLEKSNEMLEKIVQIHPETQFSIQVLGKHSDRLARALQQLYYLSKDEKRLSEAIAAHAKATAAFTKGDMHAHAAESNWYIAQLLGQIGKHQEASQKYKEAFKSYDLSAKKIPQLKDFYEEYSFYMRAWGQIEQAKYAHSIENYEKARQHYEEAAKLHESTENWSYLSPNYFAWVNLEEAEGLSRKESTQQAKQTFQRALQLFTEAENSIKQKLGAISTPEEKEMAQGLLQATDLRRRFCQARIQMEEAKLLDRRGKYLESSKSYGEAALEIGSIIEKTETESERKELELLATLCQAWEKMAIAEETTSSESYIDAARLFEKAKKYCYTKKASLWALGNSNFCKGLAAGAKYQVDVDLANHARAKSYIKNAATNYLQAGFETASEYAKATQRLFDAYLVMNQAEAEADQELRAKKYQIAENLLETSAGSFMKAKQPEKTTQVKKIIENVREERSFAVSLNEVLRAPTIASSTMSFSAPSPTNEVSVGLEQFQHANVQANLIAASKNVKIGESFCLSIEFVNAGKEPALLTRVEDFVPPDFIVVKKPEIYRIEESCLNMKGKQIAPLKLVEAKLVLQPSKKGTYQLSPRVHYLDELGQNKSLQLKSVEIKVEEVILADRISTGTKELDSLLLGGVPREYAVVLTGPPSDEREIIIKNFLEAGTKEGQTSFYVTTEAEAIEKLLEKKEFYLFLCNPKPKVEVPDLPNVYRLHGKTDLTNLNISLLKAYRNVEISTNKRVCLEILSDVLVDYGVKATRKWIAELITDLISKNFTVLAILDPGIHPEDQANAIIHLFDGEINLAQTEDPLECKKSLRIKKLRNQDYIKNPMCLAKT